jgi:hypothetical protein
MSGRAPLERRYRRVLACYPKAFRRESGEEILAVLLATAGEGQRRVRPAETADLLRGALGCTLACHAHHAQCGTRSGSWPPARR